LPLFSLSVQNLNSCQIITKTVKIEGIPFRAMQR